MQNTYNNNVQFANAYFNAIEGSTFFEHAHYNNCAFEDVNSFLTYNTMCMQSLQQEVVNSYTYYITVEVAQNYVFNCAVAQQLADAYILHNCNTLHKLASFTQQFINKHKKNYSNNVVMQELSASIFDMQLAANIFAEYS